MTAISSVRGIGVADMDSTSTFARRALRCSLCSTPNLCSSSTMTSPRSLKRTSGVSNRCVPMTMSIDPSDMPDSTVVRSLSAVKRDSAAIRTGKLAYLSLNVARCCWTRRVVGTRIATCLPSWTALNAARTAISVFPYPTSPQTSRSIGVTRCISTLTSSIQANWSGVSTYANASSSSRCQGVSGAKAWPVLAWRAAYKRTSSPAISLTALRALPFVFAQSLPPRRCTLGDSPPTYRVIMSSWSIGRNSRSAG